MPIHISGYLYEWKAAIRILKLYIIPEHNQADKKRNVETLNLANAIKAQKILEIYNQTYGFNHNRLSNMKLTGYMKSINEKEIVYLSVCSQSCFFPPVGEGARLPLLWPTVTPFPYVMQRILP